MAILKKAITEFRLGHQVTLNGLDAGASPLHHENGRIDNRRGRTDVNDGRKIHDDIIVTLPKLIDEIPEGRRCEDLIGMDRLLIKHERKERQSG